MHVTQRYARESGRDYALRVLKDNIIRLELEPGSMVSESELASELGLSRGPVREALIELAEVNIVEVYPQRGILIALVDYDLIDQAGFMRETMECAVVERCCQRGIKPESLAGLRENVELQRFYLENLNRDKLWELDNDYHRRLFANAGLTHIHTLMSRMLVHFDRVRIMALTAERKNKSVEDHRSILDLIVQGDMDAAKSLMHKHLTSYQVDKQLVCEQYPQYIK